MEPNHRKDVAFNNMLNHVLDGKSHASELAQEIAHERFDALIGFQRSLASSPANGFHPGQIVQWKSGLKNRRLPEYGQPAIVMDVLNPPVYDTSKDLAGSNLFREPLTLVLGLHDSDGDFLCYHFDGRRFEVSNDTGDVHEQ